MDELAERGGRAESGSARLSPVGAHLVLQRSHLADDQFPGGGETIEHRLSLLGEIGDHGRLDLRHGAEQLSLLHHHVGDHIESSAHGLGAFVHFLAPTEDRRLDLFQLTTKAGDVGADSSDIVAQ